MSEKLQPRNITLGELEKCSGFFAILRPRGFPEQFYPGHITSERVEGAIGPEIYLQQGPLEQNHPWKDSQWSRSQVRPGDYLIFHNGFCTSGAGFSECYSLRRVTRK